MLNLCTLLNIIRIWLVKKIPNFLLANLFYIFNNDSLIDYTIPFQYESHYQSKSI